jgi:hypothetical protein
MSASEQLARAERLVENLRKELAPFIAEVEDGDFARSVADGTCPIEAIQFFAEQTYHLAMNDMGNLSLYVAKGRNHSEVDFFLFMTVAEKLMIDSLNLLLKAIGVERAQLVASEPHIGTAFRTNYFTRLALFSLPGEIAVTILLNFPVWAAGAQRVSAGLKSHYHLGQPVEGTDKIDTDVLDRFSQATKGFEDMALRIIAADLTDDEAERRMRLMSRFAVEYEAMVWRTYYAEGVRRARRNRAAANGRTRAKGRYSGHAAGGT